MNRLHDRLLWTFLLVTCLAVAIYALWPKSPELPTLGVVADFSLAERSGRTITRQDLAGRVWIAGFTFNCCTMSCPQIRAALRDLQDELRSSRVTLVSFSVDPAGDTPTALTELADGLGANNKRWLFLTGHGSQQPEDVDAFSRASFQVGVLKNPSAAPGERFSHTNRLFLIDRQGRVRGSYNCVEALVSASGESSGGFQMNLEEMERLRNDALTLDGGPLGATVRLGWLPTWNASLNATSGVLLVIGWLLIRRRQVRAHAACMLAAVAISTLFLASYLYYHFHAGATGFTGVGWVRPAYFTILLSHTLLAITVPPLVGITLYRAVRCQWDRHRRLARWTLPVWLYVSVTGVLTYLFLYHWFAS